MARKDIANRWGTNAIGIVCSALVRRLSEWAWKREVWDSGEVHELHYRHTDRTLGGDVIRTACMSRWTTRKEAEDAEKEAWHYHGWTKLAPKKHGTETWIESHRVQSKPNAKNQAREPSVPNTTKTP